MSARDSASCLAVTYRGAVGGVVSLLTVTADCQKFGDYLPRTKNRFQSTV
jgi:hypothetical protein